MSRRAGGATAIAVGLMLACMAALPFIMLALPNPTPVRASVPGAAGNGVYVEDARGCVKLFPRGEAAAEWPRDAYVTSSDVRVYVRARQYDRLDAYGWYTFPAGAPLDLSKRMTASRMLRLTPARPLEPGRYVIRISRDDAWGGSDYFFLGVER